MLTWRPLLACCGSLAAFPVIGETTDHAPFGLAWGQSAEDVEATSVKLTKMGEPGDYGVGYTATGLTAVLSDTDTVMLFFGFKNRLWRVAAISADRPGRILTAISASSGTSN